MKSQRTLLNSAKTALAVISATLLTTQAGVLDLLKGDPAQETKAKSFQRVGFVGCAVVKEVQGNVEHLVGIDQWQPLAEGTKLAPGDLVRTTEGIVVLRMTESQSFVRLTPYTTMRLVPLKRDWDRAALSGREEKNGYTVRSCWGNAFRRTTEGWTQIHVNSVLPANTEIRTEPGSILDLYHTTSKQPLRVAGSSQLRLNPTLLTSRTLRAPNFASVSGH